MGGLFTTRRLERVNRILGPDEDLSDALTDGLRRARSNLDNG